MKKFLSKLNVQIALFFLVVSITLVSVLSVFAYYIASGLIFENIQKQTKDSVEQASNYISSYLEKIKSLSDLIAMYPATRSALSRSSSQSVSALIGMVNLSAKTDERIQTIALISKNGFAITSNNQMAIPLSENMMNESWYQGAVNSNQMPIITSIRHGDFTMDKNNWVISISHEIRDTTGEHLGVILIDVSYKFIEDYIYNLELGKDGYAYILDAGNHILYHPDESILMDEMKTSQLLELSKSDMILTDSNHVITKKEIPHSDWLLVGVSSMDQVTVLKNRFINTLILVNLLILIFSIILSVFIARRLTKPLALFELKALQSQINPHFLYNTLDTILWLAEFGENQKVILVTKSLGEMLRLSLNINQTSVPLAQEIAHTENYLKIQMERYQDKFDYIIEGEDALLEQKVPKLILQPIVENAIYHGIRPSKEKGLRIEIRYRQSGKDLILEVKNNGIPYQKEKASSVKTKLGGIGFENVNQRIKLLYGKEYGLTICTGQTGGTLVQYRLKLD